MATSFQERVRLTKLRESARLERYVRAGAGYVEPSHTIQTRGTGFAPPIVAGEETRPVTIVCGLEFANGSLYPNADGATTALWNTREFRLVLNTSGSLRLLQTVTDPFPLTVEVFNVQLSSPALPGGGVGPSGFHYIATLIKPATSPAPSSFGLWLNGDQVAGLTDVFPVVEWSNSTTPNTWTHLGGTGIGAFIPLEIFPGFIPPTFA